MDKLNVVEDFTLGLVFIAIKSGVNTSGDGYSGGTVFPTHSVTKTFFNDSNSVPSINSTVIEVNSTSLAFRPGVNG